VTEKGTDADTAYAFGDFDSNNADLQIVITSDTLHPVLCGAGTLSTCINIGSGQDTSAIFYGSNSEDDISGGTLVNPLAAPAVPEPSSIALLGTGILGTAGMIRRRILTR
jgi:hypothetical protein